MAIQKSVPTSHPLLADPTPEPVHAQAGAPALQALVEQLAALHRTLLDAEASAAGALRAVHPAQTDAARNLIHFLALRRHDLRQLQGELTRHGLSSLGRAEAQVLASVERVQAALHALRVLEGRQILPPVPPVLHTPRASAVGPDEGLRRQSAMLFGPPPPDREVRIMVTLPASAADDDALLRGLIGAGMDVARINAAHDDPATWERMATQVRLISAQLGRPTKVLIDLPGPKLRTGPLPDEAPVVRLKPRRDAYGQVMAAGVLHLRPSDDPDVGTATPGEPTLSAPRPWLDALEPGATLRCVDARGRHRRLQVMARADGRVTVACEKTAYLVEATTLRAGHGSTTLGHWPRRPGRLHVTRGDRLEVRRLDRAPTMPLSIGCTLPEVFAQVRCGDRIAFDDGRIQGVIRRASGDALDVEIDGPSAESQALGADRGINLPMTTLKLPVPTTLDLRALDVAARVADIVALSFAQRAEDVHAVHAALRARGAPQLPVLLKIETRLGFENLPALMLAAMAAPAAGVMIARGDLAVELGWQRLAEVQEEMLWAAEAAHLPVVWATQVLESLARNGQPSRAEITDAAMAVRAEAVMLNKGPYVVEAVRLLDDILRRMREHQHKKRPMLRALRAWPSVADHDMTEPAADEEAAQGAGVAG